METKLMQILNDMKCQLENAGVRAGNLSAMARLGNSSLVEKFFKDHLAIRLPMASRADQSVDSQIRLLQSYIYTCCFWGCRDILRKILDLASELEISVDLNAKNDSTLWTPLHAATFQEHGPVIMLLLESGADPHCVDKDGLSPVDFASVSDKVWPHFASRQITRTSWQELLDRNVICKLPDSSNRNGSTASPVHGFSLIGQTAADLSRNSSASSFNSAAAMNGDVLADTSSAPVTSYQQRQQSRPQSNFFF